MSSCENTIDDNPDKLSRDSETEFQTWKDSLEVRASQYAGRVNPAAVLIFAGIAGYLLSEIFENGKA